MATIMEIEIAQRKRNCDWCTVPILKGMSSLSISRYNISANLCINCVRDASDLLVNAHRVYVRDMNSLK